MFARRTTCSVFNILTVCPSAPSQQLTQFERSKFGASQDPYLPPAPPPTPLTKECITEGTKGFLLAVVDLTSSLCFTYLIYVWVTKRFSFEPRCRTVNLISCDIGSPAGLLIHISLKLYTDKEHSFINDQYKEEVGTIL